MVFLKQTVTTPYGEGVVQEIRSTDDRIVIRPLHWSLANNQTPTFYMNSADVHPLYKPGTPIKCSFGNGVIDSIREIDGIYIISLTNWSLADGKSPKLYLNESSFSKAESQQNNTAGGKSQISFQDAHERSMLTKAQAKEYFQGKKFTDAKIKYLETLEIMRTIETELTNEEKGKFVELSIFCHSNLAVCSFYENDFAESIRYGQSTIKLIEAIESQDQTNQVWAALQTSGMTIEKLRDQKVKNLRIIAKSEIKRQNFEEAKAAITAAIAINQNETTGKELNTLLSDVTKRLSVLKKKEKNMWQKAFTKGKDDIEETSPLSSPSNQATNGVATSPMNGKSSDSVSEAEKLRDFDLEFAKRFQVANDTPTPAAVKKTKSSPPAEQKSSSSKAKDQQLIKIDDLFSSKLVPTYFFIGTFGLLAGLAYWWNGRRR